MGQKNYPGSYMAYINVGTKENPQWKPVARHNEKLEYSCLEKENFLKKIMRFFRKIFR